jgi:hypothetical protein
MCTSTYILTLSYILNNLHIHADKKIVRNMPNIYIFIYSYIVIYDHVLLSKIYIQIDKQIVDIFLNKYMYIYMHMCVYKCVHTSTYSDIVI